MSKVLSKLCDSRFIRFGVVGIANTIVGYVTFVMVLMFHGTTWGALVISNVVGVANSFIWNSKWTFKSNSLSWNGRFTIVRFCIVYLVTMYINKLLLAVGDHLGLRLVVAQIPAIMVTTLISYFGHKYWSFKNAEGPFAQLEN